MSAQWAWAAFVAELLWKLAACNTLGIPSAVQSRHTQCEREQPCTPPRSCANLCDRGA